MKQIVTGSFLVASSLAGQAAVRSEAIEYHGGDTKLTGHL